MSICLTTILKIIRTNQQQLNKMANPYTQGLRYNYKPLDLSTIGKAAVMNQGQYDQTQSALDEFDVAINALPQQEEWAKDEMGKYREKIDTLSEGLAQSKDPRASMRQLQKLNKEYKRRTGPGGDIAIVEGNVATMNDYRKRHQKMIADGKNVPANFNTFLSMQMEGFKGFDDEGKLQSLSLQDMTENKSKDLMDRAVELGKLSKADVKTELGKYASVGGFRKEAIDRKLETLNNAERAVYIQEVLANSAEFKPYLDQERGLINYRNKGFDGETFVGGQLSTLDKTTEALEAQLAGKGLNENQKAAIQNNLNAVEQKRKELSQGIDKFGAMQYGRMLKSNAEYNNLTALPAGTANLRNYSEETFTRSGFTDQAALASYNSRLRREEYKEQNKFDLTQTPGGSNPMFTNMTPEKLDSEIRQLELSKSDPEKLRTLRVYQDIATKKHHSNFMEENKKALDLAGINEQDLITGKIDQALDADLKYKGSSYGVDMNFIDNKIAKLNSKGAGGYYKSKQYNDDGTVTVRIKTPSGDTHGTSKSSSHYTFEPTSKEFKAKARLISQYNSGKTKYFKEGNVTAFERFTPSTAKAAKISSENFQNNMNWNEFENSGITQEEFKALRDDKNFKLDGVFHDPILGTVVIQGTSGENGKIFKLQPKYIQNDRSGHYFGSSVNTLLNNYTDGSGRSGTQLKNTIYGDVKYKDLVPMYENKTQDFSNYMKNEDFNRSASELNPYISPKFQNQYALQSIGGTKGAVGTAIATKDDEGNYRYLVKDNQTNETVTIGADQLKNVSSGTSTKYRVGNKTDALNILSTLPSQ